MKKWLSLQQRFLWLRKHLSHLKWPLLLSLLIHIIYMLTDFVIIGVQKWIIDDVFMEGDYTSLWTYILIFATGIISFLLLNPINAYFRDRVYNKPLLGLSTDLMKHIQSLVYGKFQQERTARYVYYFTQDVRQSSELIAKQIPVGIQQMLKVILLMIIIGWASPSILALILFLSCLYIFIGRIFAPRMKKLHGQVQEDKSNLLVHIEEGISSTREVIAFHRLKWEMAIYNRLFKKYFDTVVREGKEENKHLFLSEPLKWGVTLVVLAYGGYLVIEGSLTLGMFIIVYQFSSQLMEALQMLFQFLLNVSGRFAHIARLDELFKQDKMKDGTLPLKEDIDTISFKQVSFTYDSQLPNVLNQINISMKKGQKIAFVGRSGGGKSTIAQLLIRNFEPSKGEVLVNGYSLSELKREEWLDKIAIVFQEPYLYQGTLLANLALGKEEFSMEDIEQACRQAHIHTFIQGLPDGYQTVIGERGVTLSGGQKQRIALARALLLKPEILILDEATSALDMETERIVQQNLDQAMQHGITIVIAHRLSTIENADRIHVLDQGEIAETGSHQSLLKEEGLYQGMYVEHSFSKG
ncbi:ABC transporter ATP-binding protein [Bacillus horti]|uniref:ABC-type multidrug transport system fused ATPase/permease subunit n=1 Tax=Caldalkalibacillus horti TaxID=77523 RepID=A0ABT9W3U2_9BACI|nr:ABC transporter ATP-binding protein [Bacillus horti]MDQ0167747.1 ABC-type multidrug transport system fused ATPase/permease subunit [Bacillus horti]